MSQDEPLGNTTWVKEAGLVDIHGKFLTGEVECDFDGCKNNSFATWLNACCGYANLMCLKHTNINLMVLRSGREGLACDNCDRVLSGLGSISKPQPLDLSLPRW